MDSQRRKSELGVLTGPRSVRFERLLPGPIERVWAYLTESEKREKWFCAGVTELRVGGRVEMKFDHRKLTPYDEEIPEKYKEVCEGVVESRGEVTACDPPRLLRYTWTEPGGPSEVTFELTPRGDDVLLVLTHVRLHSREDLLGVCGGWHSHLDILEDQLRGRTLGRFWDNHMALEAEYDKIIPAE